MTTRKNSKPKKTSYKKSGVDTHAADSWVNWIGNVAKGGDVSASPSSLKIISGVGDYAAVVDFGAESIALSCDGVGSKLLWTLEGHGTFESLAQDLLAMNTNDIWCVGARPRLFLDYLGVGSKKLFAGQKAPLKKLLGSLSRLCGQEGLLLVGGETAQLPELYKPTHFDLAGFCVGFFEGGKRLYVDRVQPGDELWGIQSSGPHSNGFTLLRQLYKKSKSPSIRKFIRTHLMAPTRLYHQEFLALRKLQDHEEGLRAAFHITGSGWDNLVRAQPSGRDLGFVIDGYSENDWPKWTREVQSDSALSSEQMYKTFNCGIGMIFVLKHSFAKQHRETLKQSLKARYLGVASGSIGNRVQY
jgi:phosphoribosylformylglycinamidine cyclo-ligase